MTKKAGCVLMKLTNAAFDFAPVGPLLCSIYSHRIAFSDQEGTHRHRNNKKRRYVCCTHHRCFTMYSITLCVQCDYPAANPRLVAKTPMHSHRSFLWAHSTKMQPLQHSDQGTFFSLFRFLFYKYHSGSRNLNLEKPTVNDPL